MSNKNTLYRTAFLLCGLGTSGLVAADDFHYINMQIGDRAAGMAGAYTAISDDPAGLFYNPAGISFIGSRNLSASMNAYHTTNISYKDVLGGGDWSRDSGSLVPNYFGIAQPLGEGVFGFSYAVTDALLENQDSVFYNLPGTTIQQFTLNLNNEEKTYKLGPSYARAISDEFAMGITLYGHFRNTETIFNQNILFNDGTYEWSNQYVQTSEMGVEPVLGLMWSPFDKVSLGMSIRSTWLVSASTDYQFACSTDYTSSSCNSTATNKTTPTPIVSSSTDKRSYPISTSVGLAYFPNDQLIYSIDFDFHTATNDDSFRDREATWNLKGGVEYYLYSNWALRGGLFTNNANTPEIQAGVTNQDDHVNLYGFSFSGTRFSRNSSLTLGMSYAAGNGDAQVVGGSTAIQAINANTLSLFLSSAYNF